VPWILAARGTYLARAARHTLRAVTDTQHAPPPSLGQIVREWGRIGCIGFGGPPAHVLLLRELCVERRAWLTDIQFERALAATNILPGPASTQLAIYCAWRLRGVRGALLGGAGFILPGLVAIVALAALFLSGSPPAWLRGAGMGAGAAVAAVAVRAGLGVAAPIWAGARGRSRIRVLAYGVAGGLASAFAGPLLVLVLIACGALELARERVLDRGAPSMHASLLPALAWMALKVGALAFGGGFVIVPLMQSDAVGAYHWMTHGQFLNAVALGQVTPGPLTQTVAVVGYAAAGLPGALLAAAVAFAPSFSFVLLGAARFERLLVDARVRGFLAGAAPAAAGAIVGAAVPLSAALSEWWQYALLAGAAVALLALRRGVVPTLLFSGGAGVLAALLGASVPH
jgi:chromate transporter